jgi:glyoxylate/hydroxypyruvate reductase A
VSHIPVLYQADPQRGAAWAKIFATQAPEFSFKVWPEHDDLATTEYLIAWIPDRSLLRQLPRLRVLLSLGAGVDQLDLASIPVGVRIVRLIDPGIVQGMAEYVTLSVLALHRQWPDYWQQQQREQWRELPGRLARDRRIGIMGPGVLGRAALEAGRPICPAWLASRVRLSCSSSCATATFWSASCL